MSRGVILWDFDGTLADRPGLWRGCMVEVLDEYEPDHGIEPASLIPFLRDGFPWHSPQTAHPELGTADAWWLRVEAILTGGYEGVGIAAARAKELGHIARERYVDARYWRLFDDAVPALAELREHGWHHVILSNHVPELETLIADLGLGSLIEKTINSANTGYEKPHAEAFAIARRMTGNPATIWMIGDNPKADVEGAEAAGIPAILVCRDETHVHDVPRRVADLRRVKDFVSAS